MTKPTRRGKGKRNRSSVEQLDEQNKLYGFQIGVEEEPPRPGQQVTGKSFTAGQNDDGAVTIQTGGVGAFSYGTWVDLEGTYRNETQLITKYRELAIQPEMERAINQIANEAIVLEDSGTSVEINLDNVNIPPTIKKRIEEEFGLVLKLLNFGNMGWDIFRRWYVDGRLFYHIVIDETQPIAGIQELRYIDPRRIRKVREIQKTRDPQTGVDLVRKQIEYYIYNERGIVGLGTQIGTKIAVDSIANVNSGIMDPKQVSVLSYLHKAIKPYNNLRMVEDATVIYRLSRAPERRIFYIDVGNMPTIKAEQYVRDIMVKYRNKLVYDSNTGEIKDDRKHLSMLEDFWLPRREGSKGTEISTLQGGQNLGQLEDVKYFKTKLYEALGVPISRLEPNQGFSLGRTTEITRDELEFNKFIQRLRNKFASLFDELMRVQLSLKNVCTEEEWKDFKEDIWYDFKKDTDFNEMKDAELQANRFQILQLVDPYVGRYVSSLWVRKNILHQSDEDIERMNAEMELDVQAQQQAAQQQMVMQQDQMNQQAQMDQIGHDHEIEMMDRKMEMEKLKSQNDLAKAKIQSKLIAKKESEAKKPPAKKPADKPKPKAKKKKTVSEEARDLGLDYVGNGFYANSEGEVTHYNLDGILSECAV